MWKMHLSKATLCSRIPPLLAKKVIQEAREGKNVGGPAMVVRIGKHSATFKAQYGEVTLHEDGRIIYRAKLKK